MKKLMSILIVVYTIIPATVHADWSNAKYFQCFATKRYTARAKLRPPSQVFYSWTYDGGCSYASTTISSYAVNGTSGCGYAESSRNSSGGSGSGWSSCGWSHGDNNYLSPAFLNFAPMKSVGEVNAENNANYTYSSLSDKGIHFDEKNRKISIVDINGKLVVKSTDLLNSYSTVQIEIFTFKIIKGEPVKEKNLWKAKATIIKGELFLEGHFLESDFKNKSSKDSCKFLIENVSKEYILPDNVNLENVCVKISGDGGNLGKGISPQYAPDLNSNKGQILVKDLKSKVSFDFNIILNESIVTAVVSKNNNNKLIEEVYIVSLSGQKLKTKKVYSTKERIPINISDLPSGVYLYTIKLGNEYYSKKFNK